MAAIKAYVSLFLFVLCSCRPTENELPHSRDFYAGYIKALNDNFDALFKPERQARSIETSEEKAHDEEEESRTKVLDELIDTNPEKRDVIAGINVHKRDLRIDDGLSKPSDLLATVKTTEVENSNGEVTTTTRKDRVEQALNKSVTDKKNELSNVEADSDDVRSGSKKTIDDRNDNEAEGDTGSDDVASGNRKTTEDNSDDVGSGNKKTVEGNADDASGEKKNVEDNSDNVGSGNRKTVEDSADDASGEKKNIEVNSVDLASGDKDTNENTSDDVASKKSTIQAYPNDVASKKSTVQAYPNDVRGETNFEDKEGKGEKREIRNVSDETNSDDDISGNRKTFEEADVDDIVENVKDEEDDEGSSENSSRTAQVTNANKKTIGENEGETKNETSTEKKKVVEEKKESNNDTIAQETHKTAINENSNNIIEQSEKANKAVESDKKTVVDESQQDTEKNGIEDEDDDGSENDESLKENGENIEDGGNDKDNTTNMEETMTKKKTVIGEDNTDKVENFKEDEDVEVNKKTVLDTNGPSNQLRKKTVNNEADDDDEDQPRTSNKHVIVGSKKTNIPTTNSTNIVAMKNVSYSHTRKQRRKSKVRKQPTPYLIPESEITELSNKRMEEEEMIPDVYTSDDDEEEDKELINAPEPTYISQIPGMETSTIERYSDDAQDATQERVPNEVRYQSPLMFFSQGQYNQNDNEDLRRHFILEHSNMQHLPYMPGIISGYTQHEPEERNTMPPPENNMLSVPSNNMIPQGNSPLNEPYNNEMPANNQQLVDYQQNAYFNRYPQQTPYNTPMQQVPYEDRYEHGVEENNNQAFVPESAAPVPGNTRSGVINYHHNKRHHKHHANAIGNVPSTIIDRFIQNAAQIYQFGNELARNSPNTMDYDQIGMARSSILSRENFHRPVVLQPIIVLMPYGKSD